MVSFCIKNTCWWNCALALIIFPSIDTFGVGKKISITICRPVQSSMYIQSKLPTHQRRTNNFRFDKRPIKNIKFGPINKRLNLESIIWEFLFMHSWKFSIKKLKLYHSWNRMMIFCLLQSAIIISYFFSKSLQRSKSFQDPCVDGETICGEGEDLCELLPWLQLLPRSQIFALKTCGSNF